MAKEHDYDKPDSPSSVGWTEACQLELASPEAPFPLLGGTSLASLVLEYEAYGTLAPTRDNVVLVCHALSGDAHVAGWDRHADAAGRGWRTAKPGWWDAMIGPGKPIDTNRYFVLCVNVPGSCYGSTGPASIDPATGTPYGLRFPVVTVQDWVRSQATLLDALGIERLHAVVGGSLGGQQAIEWALAYPERVGMALVLAAAPRLSAQGLGFNAVGRYAILNDPAFHGGDYYDVGTSPATGLAAARMLAHITYLSDKGMHEKFGRRLQDKAEPQFGFGVEFQVESYLDYQGRAFVERFDANSYLYITRAMDYYDAAAHWGGGSLQDACRRIQSRIMVMSFSTDWLYPPEECREFALAVCRNGKPVTYVEVPSRFGHDAFLVQVKEVGALVHHALAAGRV